MLALALFATLFNGSAIGADWYEKLLPDTTRDKILLAGTPAFQTMESESYSSPNGPNYACIRGQVRRVGNWR